MVHQVVHQGGVQVVLVEDLLIKGAQILNGVDVVGGAVGRIDPCVGQLGQDFLGDGVQGDREHGLLVAQDDGVAVGVGGVVVAFGEGHGHVKGLAGLVADDLILEPVDEGAAAQRQAVAAVGAAGKGHAVYRACVVDVHGVAAGGRAIHLLRGGVLAEDAVDLGLHILGRRLHVGAGDGDGCVVLGQGHIVQSFDARPVAVFIQTVAVRKVLVIVVGGIADGNQAGALAGRRL